jgi:pimeloyl-ACP methyl ester carboxylesterase
LLKEASLYLERLSLFTGRAAAAGYQFIAYDLVAAHGNLAATTFDHYVEQVEAWLPADGPLILVGASMGGILAFKVAEAVQPAALVLVNSVLPLGIGAPRAAKIYPPIIEWANGPLNETAAALFDSAEATIQWARSRWRDESGAVLQEITTGIITGTSTITTVFADG